MADPSVKAEFPLPIIEEMQLLGPDRKELCLIDNETPGACIYVSSKIDNVYLIPVFRYRNRAVSVTIWRDNARITPDAGGRYAVALKSMFTLIDVRVLVRNAGVGEVYNIFLIKSQ